MEGVMRRCVRQRIVTHRCVGIDNECVNGSSRIDDHAFHS